MFYRVVLAMSNDRARTKPIFSSYNLNEEMGYVCRECFEYAYTGSKHADYSMPLNWRFNVRLVRKKL